ncbi:hypothetical protein INT45_008001 [Circinella minor]|uniref:Heterokaryon incompatibility domain-containing protein n=1 Tax=Circinella minor TaxID=1195481 RepID=A0A8H7VE11_9FUNG|nr:hypothetical protein INT45_008001 [Circinella minor]
MYVTYEPKQFYKAVERRKAGANLIYQCNGPYDRAPNRIPNGLPKPDFMPCKLLRISDMQIVEGSKVQEGYCALSYSWSWCGNNVMDNVKGKARRVDEGKHRIVWRAKKVPKKPRGRKHVSRKTKFVVFEGIIQQIGKDFNVKYIWYDQWCIDQNNKEEKHREIKQMHKIYSNAYCAIALIPELVAKKNKERNSKYPFRYYADSNLIFSSDWFSRVWTLEEAIMSQKILFVGQNVHFWENVARGDIDFRALLQRPVRLNVAMVLYHAHRRETTKEHDRIFALANIFPGILDSLHVSYSQPLHDAMIQFYGLLAKQDLSILCFGEYDHYKRTFLERKYWYKSTLPSSVANWYQNVPIRKHDLPSWSGAFGEHLICSDLKSLWKTDFQNYNVIGRTMEIKTSFLSSSTFIDHPACNTNNRQETPLLKYKDLPPLPFTNNNNTWWILGITVKLPGHTKAKIIPLFSVLREFDEIDYDELIENVTPKFRLLSHFLPINKEQLIWHNCSTAPKKAYTRFTFNLTETIDDSSPRCTLLSGIPFKQNSDDDLRLYPVIQQDGNHYKAIGTCEIDNYRDFFSEYKPSLEKIFLIQ